VIRYGKMAQAAVAIMSFLAEGYEHGERQSSRQVAEGRRLSQTLTAKILSQLAAHELISSIPGPGGGYQLAHDPSEIALEDIVRIFEPHHRPLACPFGEDYCGTGPKCPLHDQISELECQAVSFLRDTSLAVFVD